MIIGQIVPGGFPSHFCEAGIKLHYMWCLKRSLLNLCSSCNRVCCPTSLMADIAKAWVSLTRSTETRPMTTPPRTHRRHTPAAPQGTSSHLSPTVRSSLGSTSRQLIKGLRFKPQDACQWFICYWGLFPTLQTFFLRNVFAFFWVHWCVFSVSL